MIQAILLLKCKTNNACFAPSSACFMLQSIGLVPTDGRRRAPGVAADRAAASKNASRNDAGRTKRRGGGAPTLTALMMVKLIL